MNDFVENLALQTIKSNSEIRQAFGEKIYLIAAPQGTKPPYIRAAIVSDGVPAEDYPAGKPQLFRAELQISVFTESQSRSSYFAGRAFEAFENAAAIGLDYCEPRDVAPTFADPPQLFCYSFRVDLIYHTNN